MAPTLAVELTDLANGAPVEVVGTGEVDAGHVRMEIRTARPHLAFDPALIAVGILDVLFFAGNTLGDTDIPTYVRTRTDLYDEHGREAGGWRVLAALTRGDGTVRLAGLLLDHRTHLELGEQVRSVDPWTVLTQPLKTEGLLLAGAWDARTGRGNVYRGVTTTVVDGWAWPWAGAARSRGFRRIFDYSSAAFSSRLGATPSAFASLQIVVSVGFRTPRSIPLTWPHPWERSRRTREFPPDTS